MFPDELARRVVWYYSFEGADVLDPFAGVGTVGRVVKAMGIRFLLVEKRADYYEIMRRELGQILLAYPTDFDDLQYRWSAYDDA